LSKTYQTPAIIFKSRNWHETDRLLTIFTRFYGKKILIAKGVRRTKSRQSGHLQTFCLAKIFCISRRGIDLITQAETIDDFTNLKKSLKRTSQACYFFELVDFLEPVEQSDEAVFDLARQFLTELNEKTFSRKEMFDWIFKLTKLTGFGPPEEVENIDELDNYLEKIVEKKLKSKTAFQG